jgi:hypothetical protein
MSVEIPQPFKTKVVSPVTIDGIPDTFHIDVTNIPTITLNIEHIPQIDFNIVDIPKIQLGVDPVEIRLTELPSIRGHLPADFCVGLSVLGMELMNVRLCGEAQIITEPYVANPCEGCGPPRAPDPQVPGTPTPNIPVATGATNVVRKSARKKRTRRRS